MAAAEERVPRRQGGGWGPRRAWEAPPRGQVEAPTAGGTGAFRRPPWLWVVIP